MFCIFQVFERSEIVPDVLDVPPTNILDVEYENGVIVNLGKEITPTQVKDHPKVTYNANPDDYYTLLMVDPDAPSRSSPTFREVKHWFVGNIKGNDVENGEHITQYFGSGPPKGTGLHRYIFLLYKQKEKLDYTKEPKTSNVSREHRFKFNTMEFAKSYELGDPEAGNFFVAQWDSFVDERNERIANLQKGSTKSD